VWNDVGGARGRTDAIYSVVWRLGLPRLLLYTAEVGRRGTGYPRPSRPTIDVSDRATVNS